MDALLPFHDQGDTPDRAEFGITHLGAEIGRVPVVAQVNSSAGCAVNDREAPGVTLLTGMRRARREVLDAPAAEAASCSGADRVSPHRGWGTARMCLARSSPDRGHRGAGAAPRRGDGRPGPPGPAAAGHRASALRRKSPGSSVVTEPLKSSHDPASQPVVAAMPIQDAYSLLTAQDLHRCDIHPGRFEFSGDGRGSPSSRSAGPPRGRSAGGRSDQR